MVDRSFLRAPFPYFGGKSRIAGMVWAALGQPDHYIEPFFGSGAVLLQCPSYDPLRHVETVNDIDGMICNVWRALQFDPDEVARWCDWPVNHVDLQARRLALTRALEAGLVQKLVEDDRYYDPVLAGYWIWSTSCWIGDGMLPVRREQPDDERLCKPEAEAICGRILAISGSRGVHGVAMARGACGIADKRPDLTSRSVVSMSIREALTPDSGPIPDVRSPYSRDLYVWFRKLSERLRYVQVVCGDWTRVCGGDWQDDEGIAGIFFDPPYAVQDRSRVYNHDSQTVAMAVAEWALERGRRKTYRIVIAGYEEHEWLLSHGWTFLPWKTGGGFANQARVKGVSRGSFNRFRERLYFSPHCLPVDLFGWAGMQVG